MSFLTIIEGELVSIEAELKSLEPAAEADIAAVRTFFAPIYAQQEAQLASVLKADGLKIVEAASAAFIAEGPDAALKASIVALKATGVDTEAVGEAALRAAVAAAQAKIAAQPVAVAAVKA